MEKSDVWQDYGPVYTIALFHHHPLAGAAAKDIRETFRRMAIVFGDSSLTTRFMLVSL
jgi:hypothetical protein